MLISYFQVQIQVGAPTQDSEESDDPKEWRFGWWFNSHGNFIYQDVANPDATFPKIYAFYKEMFIENNAIYRGI